MPNFTRQAIKASFIKLLNQQPLNKITVRSIVEDCGINRNSFYYHFQDIPALLQEIVVETAGQLIRKYPKIDSIEECILDAICCAAENKRAVLHIYHSLSRDIFEEYLLRFCDYVTKTYFETVLTGQQLCKEDAELLVRFAKLELFGAALDWIRQDMPEESMEDVRRLLTLCDGLSEELIERSRHGAEA